MAWFDILALVMLIPVQLFYSFGHLVVKQSMEFLPLMITSVSCAIVISIVWMKLVVYIIRNRTDNGVEPQTKQKTN